MSKYRQSEVEDLEKFQRWCRGTFARPPAPIRFEVRLMKSDETEIPLLAIDKEEISTMGSGDNIGEYIFDECKTDTEKLGGTNRYCIYLYREGWKDGRKPHGHFILKLDGPEDDVISDSIGRSEPLTEKGFNQSIMRFWLESQRQVAQERLQTQRHTESMISMLSTQVQRLAETHLQVIDVTAAALDRKAERELNVAREKRKDGYAEMAAKQVMPLIGPIVAKALARFSSDGGGSGAPDTKMLSETLETRVTVQVYSFLNSFDEAQVKTFKETLTGDQPKRLDELVRLFNARAENPNTPNIDQTIAVLAYDFIHSFTAEQSIELAKLVNPAQGAAFMELMGDLDKFKETRDKLQPKAAE